MENTGMVQTAGIGAETDIEGMEIGMMTGTMAGQEDIMMTGTNDIINIKNLEGTTTRTILHGGIHTGISGLPQYSIQYLTGLVCHRLHCPHHTRIRHRYITPHNTILNIFKQLFLSTIYWLIH